MDMPRHGPRSSLVDLKQRNEWAVVQALRDRHALTRPELVDATGLSRSTVANVIVDLQQRGVVDERARSPQTGPGRFGATVTLRSSAGVAVGVAIDRETIRVAAVDLSARVLAETDEPIARDAAGTDIIARCATLVRGAIAEISLPLQRIVGVGIGIPGPVDITHGGVHPAATLRRWAGLDVRRELSTLLEGAHVFPDNDANFGALGEHQYGAGRGAENLIYVRIGPGIGGGLIIDGELHRGDRGFAGEIGHITAIGNGAPCPCGRRGCLSTIASTGAIASRLTAIHGPGLDTATMLRLATDGDRHTTASLREAGTHLGRVLSGLVNALNPALVILGGELGATSSHLLEATDHALNAHIQPIAGYDLQLAHAQLGARSEVLGASARVLRDNRHVRSYVAAA
jgi:predicted NBD/HSP70 family sugar kinase